MNLYGRRKILCDEPVINAENIRGVLTDAPLADEEEKRYCVYCHTSPSGKKYIGVTCQKPEYRWISDGSGYKEQPVMWRAIQKYGFENFEHEILMDGLTEEEAIAQEIALIAEYRTKERELGYNQTNGGNGVRGYTLTEAQRAKLSDRLMGHPVSDETRAKLSLAMKQIPIPQHVREAQRLAATGRKQTQATKDKRNAKLRGMKRSKEYRETFSQSRLGENNPNYGKKQSAESNAKRSAAMIGFKHSEEAKEKIRVAMIGNNNGKKKTGRTYHQKDVSCFDSHGNMIATYESATEAAKQIGGFQSNISKCCHGKLGTYKGYIWKFA